MTERKHLKQLVRDRMSKTGERYAAARRHVLAALPSSAAISGNPHSYHRAGSIPAVAALRSLLTAGGVVDRQSGQPLSEAMLFGMAGGIGIGVFSFLYEKDDFASFFVGGRHLWHDDQAYLTAALERLGVEAEIRETGSARAADRDLRELVERGPVIAWVDQGLLPHRATSDEMLGGGYYVVAVYAISDAGEAIVGDLADDPIAIPLETLTEARGRVRKFRHRLLSIRQTPASMDLRRAIGGGVVACKAGLDGEGAVARSRRNFSLEALADWADDLVGSGARSWAHRFPRGHRAWTGLTMLYEFVELAGTGGGLCRPIFADFLTEAAKRIEEPRLTSLADDYRALGIAWSDLAAAALPDGAEELAKARDLMTERAELRNSSPQSIDRIAALGNELSSLGKKVASAFPLTDEAYRAFCQDLSERVRAIHAEEVRLSEALAVAVSAEASA